MEIPLWQVAAALALLSLVVTLLATAAAQAALSRSPPEGGPTPPVSVLKPLRGLDDGLYENLRSFCAQDYPEYELLLGAEDPHDPALDVALRVKREHPHLAISVVVCAGMRGRNPKVRVLRALLPRARFPTLLVSDSNVRARPGYLRDTAAELADPEVGMVTNPVVGVAHGDEGVGALLENLHTAAFVNQGAGFARAAAGRACVVGKSMLMRSAALAQVGGLRSVSSVLAEDYLLGRKFERAGWKVALSPHPVRTVNETWSVERFLERHLRWGQMRRRLSLAAYAGELLLNPLLFLALALTARGWEALTPGEMSAAAGVALCKVVLDARLIGRLRGSPVPAADLCWIPLKDLLVAALWPLGLVKRELSWRGNPLRIGRKSRLFVPPAAAASRARLAGSVAKP